MRRSPAHPQSVPRQLPAAPRSPLPGCAPSGPLSFGDPAMGATASTPTTAALTEPRRQLVDLMQNTNFGRIEELLVRDGQPVLRDPAPRVIQEVKFGGDNAPRPEAGAGNFVLKAQVAELFDHFDRLQNGRIEVL